MDIFNIYSILWLLLSVSLIIIGKVGITYHTDKLSPIMISENSKRRIKAEPLIKENYSRNWLKWTATCNKCLSSTYARITYYSDYEEITAETDNGTTYIHGYKYYKIPYLEQFCPICNKILDKQYFYGKNKISVNEYRKLESHPYSEIINKADNNNMIYVISKNEAYAFVDYPETYNKFFQKIYK